MIGNDIVDLRQAHLESDWQRPRYLDKIFTQEEQQQVAAADTPSIMVWLLWSCKEAAYKRWVSHTQQRRFLPKKIEVFDFQTVAKPRLTTTPEGAYNYTCSVQIIDHHYTVYTALAGDLIHSWTSREGEKILLKKATVLDQQTLSQATRSLLSQHLVQYFSWSPTDISIRKNKHGRPFIYYQNKKCPLFLSLAHHGRYGGFVVTKGDR